MSKDISSEVVDAVFSGILDDKKVESHISTTYTGADGKPLEVTGSPANADTSDWVAKVSSMSLSIKVTPKIGNDYLSVERAMTIDVNTRDKELLQGIWKNLQSQVVSGVFNTLGMTIKQIQEIKKGQ